MDKYVWIRFGGRGAFAARSAFAIILGLGVLFGGGCSRLPDLNKLQNNMDHMVYYMGIMCTSTARMAAAAERMEAKSDRLLGELQKKGTSTERAVQNYTQSFLDNHKAEIKNLEGIRMELGELKQACKVPPRGAGGPLDQSHQDNLQSRLDSLEKRFTEIMSKLERSENLADRRSFR